MTHDELLEMLIASDRDDWLRNDERGISTLKKDLNVTVRLREQDEPEKFDTEQWALNFPDKNAYVRIFELWYGGSFVQEYSFCSVDGHRARLPYPRNAQDLTITREKYAIACAVDISNTLDDYLQRANFRIGD